MRKHKGKLMAAAALLVGAGLFFATRKPQAAGVPREQVCMTNDKVFGRPQIRVNVEGRDYFGCCAGCAKRLRNDPEVRVALDPVTGARVDKASAFIVEGPDGAALYFESAKSAARYKPKAEV